MVKASDFGRNDRTFFVRTHLGHLLAAGDCALGYDMSTANTADPDLEAAVAKGFAVPDVILVCLHACGAAAGLSTGSSRACVPLAPMRALQIAHVLKLVACMPHW